MPVSFKEIAFDEVVKICKEDKKKFINKVFYLDSDGTLEYACNINRSIARWIDTSFFIKEEQ